MKQTLLRIGKDFDETLEKANSAKIIDEYEQNTHEAKQNKIFGTDVRSFLNDEGSKINTTNEPRFFGNTLLKEGNTTVIEKGVFTYCKNRGEDKCPPWVLQSKK